MVATFQQEPVVIRSHSGYPGQGGCFYGGRGRCYVSQYASCLCRIDHGSIVRTSPSLCRCTVFVTGALIRASLVREIDEQQVVVAEIDISSCVGMELTGAKRWTGRVNCVPGGGLVGVGTFAMEFLESSCCLRILWW